MSATCADARWRHLSHSPREHPGLRFAPGEDLPINIMTPGKNTWDKTAFPQLLADEAIKPAPERKRAVVEEHPFIIIEREYPRVAKAIEMTWGHRELDDYLQKLIISDRGGRDGFPQQVLAALMKLSKQHASQFNFFPAEGVKATDKPAKRDPRDSRRSDQTW
jgi:hypothetical protein